MNDVITTILDAFEQIADIFVDLFGHYTFSFVPAVVMALYITVVAVLSAKLTFGLVRAMLGD